MVNYWQDTLSSGVTEFEKIGGGVLVAVKENIHANRRHDLEKENTDLVVVELALKNCNSTLLYTIYRPPDSSPDAVQHLNSSTKNP